MERTAPTLNLLGQKWAQNENAHIFDQYSKTNSNSESYFFGIIFAWKACIISSNSQRVSEPLRDISSGSMAMMVVEYKCIHVFHVAAWVSTNDKKSPLCESKRCVFTSKMWSFEEELLYQTDFFGRFYKKMRFLFLKMCSFYEKIWSVLFWLTFQWIIKADLVKSVHSILSQYIIWVFENESHCKINNDCRFLLVLHSFIFMQLNRIIVHTKIIYYEQLKWLYLFSSFFSWNSLLLLNLCFCCLNN